MNSYLLGLVNRKSESFKRFRLGLITSAENNRLKNLVTNEVRKAKINYHKNLFERCRGNIQQTWRNIKNLIGSNDLHGVDKIIFENIEYTQKDEISKLFAQYFENVFNVSAPAHSIDSASLVPLNESSIF